MAHTVHVSCCCCLFKLEDKDRVCTCPRWHNVMQHAFLDVYECMYTCEYILYFHCECLACHCTGSTANIRKGGGWQALATRLTPSGVCCHFSGEVPLTRCKRRRQQRRTATVFPVSVFLCVCFGSLFCASTMSTSSQASLVSRGCCSIKHKRLQLSNQNPG